MKKKISIFYICIYGVIGVFLFFSSKTFAQNQTKIDEEMKATQAKIQELQSKMKNLEKAKGAQEIPDEMKDLGKKEAQKTQKEFETKPFVYSDKEPALISIAGGVYIPSKFNSEESKKVEAKDKVAYEKSLEKTIETNHKLVAVLRNLPEDKPIAPETKKEIESLMASAKGFGATLVESDIRKMQDVVQSFDEKTLSGQAYQGPTYSDLATPHAGLESKVTNPFDSHHDNFEKVMPLSTPPQIGSAPRGDGNTTNPMDATTAPSWAAPLQMNPATAAAAAAMAAAVAAGTMTNEAASQAAAGMAQYAAEHPPSPPNGDAPK